MFGGVLRRLWVLNIDIILVKIHSIITGYVSRTLEGVIFFSC